MFKDRMGKQLTAGEAGKKISNRIANIWLDFWLLVLYEIGINVPFHSIRKFFYRISGMKIGKGSTIHTWARFFNPKGIEIGEDTIIGDHVFLDGRALLKIGSHVDIASHVQIYNSQHDIDSQDFGAVEAPVEIADYVFIGPRAIVLPGVKIGRGAVVAAGAVVTSDIGEFEVWGGVPTKFIRQRKLKDPHYKIGRARLFQ
jgi:maltose O-acetyltransferase